MKFVQIIPLGPKMAGPGGSNVLRWLIKRKHKKNFLSETLGLDRALTFGMYHHLVDLYQVCSNYTPGSKNVSAPGVKFIS